VFARERGVAAIDADGQRCRETRGLELHHLQAFAWGGEHSAAEQAAQSAPVCAPLAVQIWTPGTPPLAVHSRTSCSRQRHRELAVSIF
jgi:hypothetical protein